MLSRRSPSLTTWLAPCITAPSPPHRRNLGESSPFCAAANPRSAPRPPFSPRASLPGTSRNSRTSLPALYQRFPLHSRYKKKKGGRKKIEIPVGPARAGIGSRSARTYALAPSRPRSPPKVEPSESGPEPQGYPRKNPAPWEKRPPAGLVASGRPVHSKLGARSVAPSVFVRDRGARGDGGTVGNPKRHYRV